MSSQSNHNNNNNNNNNGKRLTLLAPVPIEMIDHNGTEQGSGKAWCKNIMIGEYTIITGTNNVRFVVWTITIETVRNSKIVIRKRYNDFVQLRDHLIKRYPDRVLEIPKLPTKSVLLNFDPHFLEKRRSGLEFFISSILLNPSLCDDDEVKVFVMA